MQIITRKSEGIRTKEDGFKGIAVSFQLSNGKGQITFSKEACVTFGLKPGDKVSFLSDIDRLYFMRDEDAGFKMAAAHGGLRIYCTSLLKKIFE